MLGLQPLPLPWTFDPAVVAGLLLVATGHWYLRRRTGGGRPLLFYSGLLAFAVALVSPLDAVADRYLLSAHMLQHILLTMAGPPLLLAGLPPVPRLARLGRLLVNPWLAVTVFNVVLMTWHLPAFYEATLHHEGLHILEHLMFMAAALLFWWPIVGPGSGAGGMSPLMKVGYLAFAGVPPTVVGMILAISPAVLYPFYASSPRLLGAVSARLDQELAGILMFGIGNLIYFVPITRNFTRLMAEPDGVVPI